MRELKSKTILQIRFVFLFCTGPRTRNEQAKKKPKLTCIVGLTTEPERLVDIRRNRMNTIKESEATTYTSFEIISKEVEEAKKLFKKYNWPTIDVTRKSVEETAASVIKIYEIEKKKV